MRFTHTDVNFDVTDDGHQKTLKMSIESIFVPILMTLTCDIKIDVNMCEPHYVNLFFVDLLHGLDL